MSPKKCRRSSPSPHGQPTPCLAVHKHAYGTYIARYSQRARKIYFFVDDKSDKKMSHGQGKEEKTRKAKKKKKIGPNPKQKRYQEKETTIRACNLELRGSWIRIPSGALLMVKQSLYYFLFSYFNTKISEDRRIIKWGTKRVKPINEKRRNKKE